MEPETDAMRTAVQQEASALSRVTFYDIYIFLWKLLAALIVFAIPFFFIFAIIFRNSR